MSQKILLVDDHSIVRKGLRFHCQEFGFTDVDEAIDCTELMAALRQAAQRQKEYTHLVLDLELSDELSLEILPNIRALYPNLNILIFSMKPYELYEPALQTCGITGFISKDAPEGESIRLLKAFFDNASVMAAVRSPQQIAYEDNHVLTPRETEVLHHLLRGERDYIIREKLNIAKSTMGTLKQRIYEKTGTSSLFGLQEWAKLYLKTARK